MPPNRPPAPQPNTVIAITAPVDGNAPILGWVEEFVQRGADGENEGKHLETVERPPQVRRDQRFPLRLIERLVPPRSASCAQFAHTSLPNLSQLARVRLCLHRSAGEKLITTSSNVLKATARSQRTKIPRKSRDV